jgi:hypothetical protein
MAALQERAEARGGVAVHDGGDAGTTGAEARGGVAVHDGGDAGTAWSEAHRRRWASPFSGGPVAAAPNRPPGAVRLSNSKPICRARIFQ